MHTKPQLQVCQAAASCQAGLKAGNGIELLLSRPLVEGKKDKQAARRWAGAQGTGGSGESCKANDAACAANFCQIRRS